MEATAKATEYRRVSVRPLQNEISSFKPSDLLQEGDFPFSDYQQNSVVLTFVGNFHFFRSTDLKQVA